MWRFNYIDLENFRSFEQDRFTFITGQTYLVQGLNLSNNGSESNGSGKSSIGEAIRYVLGLPVYVEKQTDLINYDANETKVTLSMTNEKLGENMVITRTTPRKGSSTLLVEVNGADQKDRFATLPEGDKFILAKIGVSKEDLLNFYIISEEKYTSFLSGSDTAKKDLINRFSKADAIDGIEDLIEADLAPIRKEIEQLTLNRSKAEGRIEGHEEDIYKLKEDIAEVTSEHIEELENDVANIKAIIEEFELQVANLSSRKELLQSAINLKIEDSAKVQKKINALTESYESIRKRAKLANEDIKEFSSGVAQIEVLLAGIVECPECHTQFNPSEEVDTQEASTLIEEYKEAIAEAEERVTKADRDKKALDEKESGFRDEIKANNTYIQRANRIIQEIDRRVRSANNDKDRAEEELFDYKSEIESLRNDDRKSRIAELEGKILAEKKVIEGIDTTLDEKRAKIASIEVWIPRFKSFKSHLANKSLSSIQGFANMYLERMGTDLNLRLDGFKQNKDGSIREKITPTILRNGMVEGSGSFKNYSKGERCRIDIAPTLACQHLINLSSPTGGVDYMMIDEITGSLDPLGIESLARSLQELGVTCNLISHVRHNKVFDNIITVVKENGVSRIVEP